MLKKFTALLLAVFMLTALATAQSAEYTGVWYLLSIESEGVTLNPADMGMEMTITLNDDGSGLVSSTGEEETPATWTLEDDVLTVVAEEDPLSLVLNEEGQLVASIEGTTMIFDREPPVAGFEAAAEVAAEDIADFDGTWNITMVNAYGMVVPFAAMAESGLEDATVLIENGVLTAFEVTSEEAGTLVDGKLMIGSSMGDEYAQSVSLLEDGTLAFNYMGIIFYCEKVEVME